MSRATVRSVVVLTSLANAGCDDVDWPEPRYVDSLRVLAVRAEPPTLTPGASTRLSVLCVDGSRGAAAAPDCEGEVAWFTGCDNPEKNDPDRCLERYSAMDVAQGAYVATTPSDAYPSGFQYGRSLDFSAPSSILTQQFEAAGQRVRYGTSYVFFALCAGRLAWTRNNAQRLPLNCLNAQTGAVLDQRSFVVGVTTIYSYDRVTNRNPELLAAEWDGIDVPNSCFTAADCPDGFECAADSRCAPVVPHCRSADPEDCAEHCLSHTVAGDSFSLFALDGTAIGAPQKSLWLNYLTNSGRLPDDEAGFGLPAPTDAMSTLRTPCIRWQAPTSPTAQAYVWAVVRDSRGGVSVAAQHIIVR